MARPPTAVAAESQQHTHGMEGQEHPSALSGPAAHGLLFSIFGLKCDNYTFLTHLVAHNH